MVIKQSPNKGQEKILYYKRKAPIIEKEKNNDQYVALCRERNGWWNAFNNSAVYYAKLLAPRLNWNVKLDNDRDHCHKATYVTHVKDIKKFLEGVKSLGLEIVNPLADGEDPEKRDYITIKLSNRVEPVELNRLLKQDQIIWTTAERQLKPVTKWAKLKKAIIDFQRVLSVEASKMNASNRRVYGDESETLVKQMFNQLVGASHGRLRADDALVAMADLEDELEANMLMMMSLQIVRNTKVMELAEGLKDIREIIEKEMENLVKAEMKNATPSKS